MAQDTSTRPAVEEDTSLSRALVVWDRLDNELIEAQLAGRSVTTWAYTFRQDGKQLQGLSVAGIEECSRLAAMRGEALRVLDWKIDDQGDAYFAIVQCGRYAVKETGESILLDTAIGTKRERKVKVRRSGGYYTDENAADIAISKAARNAKAKLLDPQLKDQVLAAAVDSERVAVTAPGDADKAERAQRREAIPPPPAKVDEDNARRRFYATAREYGLLSQAQIHARLKLNCAPGAKHDINPKDPSACNSLRDAVDTYARQNEMGKAEAWEYFRERLTAGDPGELERESVPDEGWQE